jgi:type I restriction-modification system DNA methylase subunit/restriction endonuclease S subunit
MSAQMQKIKTDDKAALTNMFKNCLNILRDNEGLTGEKALRNMSYLLTLKLIEPRFGNGIDIDGFKYDLSNIDDTKVVRHKERLLEVVRFSNLVKEKEDNIPLVMKSLWRDVLSAHPATRNIFLKGKGFDIEYQSTYKKLFNKIDALDVTNSEYDILGSAYEEVIQDIMTGKVLGQFFTQPQVKNMMVKLIDPQMLPDGKIETCGDPTMGTGGFLITYLRYVLKQANEKEIKPDWDFIKTEGLYGKELEPDTYQLAVSNMLISSGHMFEQLERGDSIREPITRKFDNILANPPFGIKGMKYIDFRSALKTEYVPIKSDNAVSLFVQAIIYMLKVDGKCAVVLPDGQDLFSKTNKTLVLIRQYLMTTCDLKEIIYMPAGIFTNTSIKTCVFYFVKKVEGTEVLDVKISYSKTTQKEVRRTHKFTEGPQTTSVKFYDWNPDDDSKTLLVDVPIDKIVENCYSLNYAEYLEKTAEEYGEGIEVKTLGEVCEFSIGGTPSRSNDEYYNNGTNLWASVRELNGGYIYDTKEKITDLGVEKSSVKLFAKDTILFSFKLSIGKTAIVGTPLYTNEAIAGIISKDNNLLSNKYLYYYLTINDFSMLGSGILGKGSLNKKSLEQIKIPIPPIERQREVVKYLDFIYENAIKTSSEKIAELKMLNGFCLKSQKMSCDNEIKTLGEVCEFQNGSQLDKKNIIEGNIPVFGGGIKNVGFHNAHNRIGDETIVCGTGAYSGYVNYNHGNKFWASQCFTIKSADVEIITNKYLYYYSKTILEYQFTSNQKGTAIPFIRYNQVLKYKIHIPPIECQRVIVEYCEFNDELIKQLEKEIENNTKLAQQIITNAVKTPANFESESDTGTGSITKESSSDLAEAEEEEGDE